MSRFSTQTRAAVRPPVRAFVCALLLATTSASAQDSLASEPRTWLQLHGTLGQWRLTTEGSDTFGFSTSTPLQAESQLGMKKQHGFAGVALGRRIGQNWRIELDRTSAKRSGSAVLASDLSSDGSTFARGTTLRSEISLTTLRINGGWSLLHTSEQEAGLIVGGQWVSVSRHFDGQQRQGVNTLTPVVASSSDVAPIPIIGGFGSFKLGSAWRLTGRLELGLGGDLHQQLQLGAQWQATPNLALSAGYRATRTDVDLLFGFIACCSQVKLDYRVHGPSLGLELAF